MKKATIAKLLVVCLIASMLCIPAGAVVSKNVSDIDWGNNKTYELTDDTTLNGDFDGAYAINAGAHKLTVTGTVKEGATLTATYGTGSSKAELFSVNGEAVLEGLAAQKGADDTYSISGSVTLKGNATFEYLTSLLKDEKSLTVTTTDTGKVVEATTATNKLYTICKVVDEEPITPPPSGGGTTTPTESNTVTVRPTVSGNKATATVSDSQLKKLVNSDAKEVIVKVNAPSNVTEIITNMSVKGLADKALTIATPLASITLPPEALKALGDNVATAITKVDDNTVKIAVGKNNDEELTSISGGLKVVVPVENATTGTVAFIVDAEGNKTLLKKSAADKDGNMAVLLDGSATITFADNSKEFNDVASHWGKEAVDFVSSRELFQGMPDGAFEPDTTMDRAMIVTVLYRLEGTPAGGTPVFGDVNSSEWYADAVAWASSNEIVKGLADGSFGPKDAVTREQIATFLYRYAKVMGVDTTPNKALTDFDDGADTSDWAQDAMQWAVGAGLIQGYGEGSLDPQGVATRAQVAQMLMKLVNYMTTGSVE